MIRGPGGCAGQAPRQGMRNGEVGIVRCPVAVKNQRRVLCVFPTYTPAFGTFQHAYKLMYGVKAFMPPQGLLLIAAYMPESWPVRFVDENIKPATRRGFRLGRRRAGHRHAHPGRADPRHPAPRRGGRQGHGAGRSVGVGVARDVSGLRLSPRRRDGRRNRRDRRAHRRERRRRPRARWSFKTKERLPLTDFPIPAYDRIPFGRYLLGTVQFSSGCPYLCEFCDIPGLYGRQPRMKTPQQVVAELDFIFSQPNPPTTLYFVDDNFIGNRKAAKEMLPHLVEWQKRNHYPVMFACEATLNIAKQTDILELMKEANFVGMFVGIETPEADALDAIKKGHNNAVPMLESIRTLNSYGIEITSGIILGLDTETPDTEQRLKDFIDVSQIPMLTINLLQALPKTPLWDRLKRDGPPAR